MPSDAAGPVAPIVSPNVISWAAAPVTHANANARTTDKCRIMGLPSDERLVILAESMEHLAAVLKPLAPEKTVGGEACLAAMKRKRNPGYALRRGDACVALYQRQRCRKRARDASPLQATKCWVRR